MLAKEFCSPVAFPKQNYLFIAPLESSPRRKVITSKVLQSVKGKSIFLEAGALCRAAGFFPRRVVKIILRAGSTC
jgi:hypothetical protein